MSYRISVLKRALLDRVTPDDAARCAKVWEGERCRLGVHDDDGSCIIAPPAARTDSSATKGDPK